MPFHSFPERLPGTGPSIDPSTTDDDMVLWFDEGGRDDSSTPSPLRSGDRWFGCSNS